jgi:hypothetical protein
MVGGDLEVKQAWLKAVRYAYDVALELASTHALRTVT